MKFETRREREARLKRQRRSSIAGMLVAFLLVAVIGISMWNSKQALARQNAEYEEQKAELEAQIKEQEERKAELEEYKKYIQTKKFVEEIAKDKFGLLYPNEMVIKPQK